MIGRELHLFLGNLKREDVRTNLYFSQPFHVFLLFGIIPAVQHLPSAKAIGFIGYSLFYVCANLYAWTVIETAPLNPQLTRRQLAVFGGVVATTAVLVFFPSFGSLFYGMFALPILIMCVPRPYFPRTLAGIIAVEVAIHALFWNLSMVEPAQFYTSALSTIAGALFNVLVRRNLYRDRERDLAAVRSKVEAAQAERVRLASDLHDQLGQSLTAINTLAQLTRRLLETGALPPAQERLATIEEMSRQALAQMRAVVKDRYQLTIAEELESACQLLQFHGVKTHVSYLAGSFSRAVEDGLAHVIREAATNVARHSGAANCWITITDRGVTVRDDGRGVNATNASQGTGLESLARRWQQFGDLQAGADSGQSPGWQVRAVLSAARRDHD